MIFASYLRADHVLSRNLGVQVRYRSMMLVMSIGVSVMIACGGSSKTTTATKQSLASTTSTTTGQDVKADLAAAQAASLKLTDFPAGWISKPNSDSPSTPNIDAELAKCLGISVTELNGKGPAEVESPDFDDPSGKSVSSKVAYTPSKAKAESEFSVFADPKVPGCMTTAVGAIVDYALKHPDSPTETVPAGVTLGKASVNQMSFPTYGDKSVAYRVTIPVNASGLSISVYLDVVVAVKGRVGVETFFQGTGTPFPTEDAQKYTALVVDRLANT